ncbi:MAG: NAD(P)-dependent oxidoreductase [Rhodospirillaceae bacterium]|nr:NAD(P)-dependent oxidoreductase [Rhodospirillaceae bacterium]|tara:strand:- start:907 stop:1824 length:918 start_codon:yes stop_codon:yes gene_type:complete
MKERLLLEREPGHLFCFGLGFTATRLAKRLLSLGWKVSGTSRRLENAVRFESLGITAYIFDGSAPIANASDVFSDVTHLISSVPPGDNGEDVLFWHKKDLGAAPLLDWVTYLSTPAVYGDKKGETAYETDRPKPTSIRGQRRLAAELAWGKAMSGTDISFQIMRLAGIYGPGRNIIEQIVSGRARIIEKPGQVFNRIHVDDIGTILIASMLRPCDGRVYNVADNEACPSGDVVRFACELLKIEPPKPIDFEAANLSDMARSFYGECKVLATTRLKDELLVQLQYPTYREGLRNILENKQYTSEKC